MGIYKQANKYIEEENKKLLDQIAIAEEAAKGVRGTFNYVPKGWETHATPEEREFLKRTQGYNAKVENEPILGGIFGGIPATAATIFPFTGVPALSGALLLAAANPEWTKADAEAHMADPSLKTKLRWIPGYATYTNLKMLGLHNRMKDAIEQRYKE